MSKKKFINLLYSIDYINNTDAFLFFSNESNKPKEILSSENMVLENINWKKINSLMNKTKTLWRMNHFNNTDITLDIQNLSKDVFSKLKSCEENMTLRKKNLVLENEINTEFQSLLFDYLYEEQEIYSSYDDIFDQKKYEKKSYIKNILANKKMYFNFLIENYQKYFLEIYNDTNKINCFKKLRWYLLFDKDNFIEDSFSILSNGNKNNSINDSLSENEKEILYNKFISNDKSLLINNDIKNNEEYNINEIIIDKLLSKENNPILYIVKLIAITITLYCKETMRHLNIINNSNNKEKIIKEYIKRFNNFIQAAKYINTKCQNLNIVINYLDKEILTNYPHFPKFSIFKLCLKIWYGEMSSILSNDKSSVLTKIKNNIIKIFEEYTNEDLNNILKTQNNNSYNSIQSFITSSSKNNSNLFFSSSSKNFNLSTSISLFSSNAPTLASTLCPFNSYYEEDFSKFYIIEKGLGIIYETFSDEYSVYLFNMSNLDTNNYFNDVENGFIEIINKSVKNIFRENLISNININKDNDDDIKIIKKLKDKILNYFGSYFFNKKIINKLKQKIYSNITNSIKNAIFEYISKKIKQNSINNNSLININIQVEEKYINELRQYLSNNNDINLEKKISQIKSVDKIFNIISELDNWMENENENFKKLDKKISKELDKKNISSSYNILQKYLLSYSVQNNWEIIKKIKAIENYHFKINSPIEQENKSLKNTVNAFSLNNNIEEDNDIFNDKLNNFDNGMDALKGSNIFF